MILENNVYRIEVSDTTGVISSVFIKTWNEDLIKEKRLADSFRLNLPLPERLDNYVYGKEQKVEIRRGSKNEIEVRANELGSSLGLFPVYFAYTIAIRGDEIHFQCHAENKCDYPLAEIWYPIIGGICGITDREDTICIAPGYLGELHPEVFQRFSNRSGLGNEDAIQALVYPGALTMPWIDFFNKKKNIGLYVAEHNEVCRVVYFLFQLTPGCHEGVSDDNWPYPNEVDPSIPIGVMMSRVVMPHTKKGHIFNSGVFILKIHTGDWHKAAKIYRRWFISKFPFDKTNSWLRKEQAWFSSIIYQPEDRVIANYEKYTSWMKEAINMGITTGELLGWDKGGIERDYPEYIPEEKLGGKEGYKKMMEEIHKAGGHVLTFVNYHILDSCTEWFEKELHKYRKMDSFGNSGTWFGWGYSTLKAMMRADVRHHVFASPAVPQLRKVLEDYFEEIARDGSDGFQIDKMASGGLDFNPLHDRDPDLPMCQDLIRAIERVYQKCKAVNPDFQIASETNLDRFIPYVDVFYRAGSRNSISTLRYTFPEWTACVHCGSPFGYNEVNGALLFGMVLVVEPRHYNSAVSDPASRKLMVYIKECLHIRRKLFDRIFLSDYLDSLDAEVSSKDIKGILYKVHARYVDGKRTIVVVNYNTSPRKYNYRFTHKKVSKAKLYQPFKRIRMVSGAGELEIPGERLHIITEE